MINQPISKTNKRPVMLITAGLGLLIVGLISVLLLNKWDFSPTENTSSEHSEQNPKTIISENLEYVLKNYLGNYIMNYTEDALRNYFPSIYSSNTLINLVSFDNTHEAWNIRIVDSHGAFHTIVIQEKDDTVKVAIDEYEKTYEIDIIKHEDEG